MVNLFVIFSEFADYLRKKWSTNCQSPCLILVSHAMVTVLNFVTKTSALHFVTKTSVLHFVTKTSIDTAKNGPLKMASTARTALGWRNVSDSSDWHHVVQTSFENPRNVSTCVKRLLHDPLAVIFVSNSQDCFNMYLDVVEEWRTSHSVNWKIA